MKAMLSALKNKPSIPRIPASTSHGPVNKRISSQRYFTSTKKRQLHKKRVEATASKPSAKEKAFSRRTLDGNVEIVSGSQINTDHALQW